MEPPSQYTLQMEPPHDRLLTVPYDMNTSSSVCVWSDLLVLSGGPRRGAISTGDLRGFTGQ